MFIAIGHLVLRGLMAGICVTRLTLSISKHTYDVIHVNLDVFAISNLPIDLVKQNIFELFVKSS